MNHGVARPAAKLGVVNCSNDCVPFGPKASAQSANLSPHTLNLHAAYETRVKAVCLAGLLRGPGLRSPPANFFPVSHGKWLRLFCLAAVATMTGPCRRISPQEILTRISAGQLKNVAAPIAQERSDAAVAFPPGSVWVMFATSTVIAAGCGDIIGGAADYSIG